MARFAVILAPAFVWVAAFVATSDDEAGIRLLRRLSLLMPLRLAVFVRRVAASRLVASLLQVPSVSHLSDEVAARLRGVSGTVVREEACAVLLGCATFACLVCSLMARSLLGVPVTIGAEVIWLQFWDASRARRAEQELVQAMPGVFRTLAMAMSSGETLAQAIDYVGSHESGAAGRAFHRASLRLRCGESVGASLDGLVNELDAPGVGLLATALAISQRTGSPLKALFQHSAALVERQGEFERTLAVKTAQVRLSVRIVSLLPVLMVSVLSLLSLDFRRGLFTLGGMACVLLAALMDGIALVIIRRLMKGVL